MINRLLTFLLIFISTLTYSQIIPKEDIKSLVIKSSFLLVSGFSDGTSEVLKIKYSDFERVFPNCNDQFWNYNISWTNKYKNGIAPQPRFPGSTTMFVATTDGYHLMRAIRNSTMIVGIVIPIGKKKKFIQYVVEGVVYYTAYTTGFNLSYDIIFK